MCMLDEWTWAQKYDPAMQIRDQAEADAYFEACVEHCMRAGKTRHEAEAIERSNLGYWAGYYDNATRERVERLYACAHPVFGPIAEVAPPTPEEALLLGRMRGEASLVAGGHITEQITLLRLRQMRAKGFWQPAPPAE